jgi:hypothetical protein
MNIFFKKEQPRTLTAGRSFMGVMVDPEIDSYFIIRSKTYNSSKSEEVRKELKKAYEAGISDAIGNIVRKILISVDPSTISRENISKELKIEGIAKCHIEQIIELLWRELENQKL